MNLAAAPDFGDIDANASEFRQGITMAGIILEGVSTSFGVYSRHSHERAVIVKPGQVLFEQLMADGTLKLFPLDLAEAKLRGKPSCWAFAPSENGEVIVHELRYADVRLHERAGIDVTAVEFRADLRRVANAFVAEQLHGILEVNITCYLFAPPTGHLTRERTFGATGNEVTGHHIVDFAPTPSAVLEGDWSEAACWSFRGKRPVVTGWCWSDTVQGVNHKDK